MIVVNRRSYVCTLSAVLVPFAFAAGQDSAAPEAPSPLDQLREENIPEYERRVAAERNGGTLPEGLVAIVGDSRWQHTMIVRDIAVLPDGKTCITAGGTTLILWDLQTGEALRVMAHVSTRELFSIALSGDGATLAAGGRYGDATLWELPDGQLRHRLQTQAEHVAISHDGRRIFTSCSGLADISVWDGESGQLHSEISTVTAGSAETGRLSISPSEMAIDRAGRITAAVHRVVPPAGHMSSLSRIVLRDAKSGRELRVLEGHAGREVRRLVFSDDGQQIAACAEAECVRLWNVADGKLVWEFQPVPGEWARDVQFSPGGHFVWALTQTTLLPIDRKLGRAGTPVAVPPGASCFGFLPDGECVVFACGGPRVLNLKTGEFEFPSEPTSHRGNILAVAFSAFDRQLATGGDDGLVILWDVDHVRPMYRLQGHRSGVTTLACSPDGSLLASGDREGTLLFWETATGRMIASHTGPKNPQCIVFDGDGLFAAVLGLHGEVDVWDLSEWKVVQSFDFPGLELTYLAFLHGRRTLVSGCAIGDIDSGQVFEPFPDRAAILAVSPDAARAVWGGRLGSFTTGESIAELNPPGSLVAAAYSPNGRWIAGISREGKLLIADGKIGRQLWSTDIVDPESFNSTLSFSHDGRYLAYPAGNGTVHIIRIPLPAPQPE
jgi:WD40 repeat protein